MTQTNLSVVLNAASLNLLIVTSLRATVQQKMAGIHNVKPAAIKNNFSLPFLIKGANAILINLQRQAKLNKGEYT